MSLCLLGALTPEGHEQTLVDARFHDPGYDDDSDLIAISAFTGEAPHAYEMADEYRKRGKTVVIGGIHVSMCPDEALKHADCVVIGEAESTWPQVIKDFEAGCLKKTYTMEKFHDLKGLAIPKRSLLDKERYFTISSAQATRGCPFDCSFCAVTIFNGRKMRTRDIGELVEEVRALPNKKNIMFLDDNIAILRDYAMELFEALKPLNIKWSSQASINCTKDPKLMKAMRDSGCDFLLIGFESVDQASLDASNKGKWCNMEKYARAIKVFHEYGINMLGSFVVGLDNDDTSIFPKTYDFITDHGIDAAIINILTPYPGTALYKEYDAEGRIFDRDWGNYYNSNVVYHPKKMTAQELLDGFHWLMRKLYTKKATLKRIFRPKRNFLSRTALNVSYHRKASKFPDMAFEDIGKGPSTLGLTPEVQSQWTEL